ncbi:ComEC/Rec2 family competence protein [Paenarthrobacter sp. NPDC092416]|uniref:ComEC/Rec2 family competence protein n=1 Tax=Paenarthrobacter sp. NPDC092416 TaxID=3364386 RepID=UPI003801C7BF
MRGGLRRPARTVSATLAVACLLGAAVAAHCALAAASREDGPLARSVEARDGVVIQLVITDAPREAPTPGHSGSGRWQVAAHLVEFVANGAVVQTSADVMVLGGEGWRDVRPGQRVRTTGTLNQVQPGQAEAAVVSASSPPTVLENTFDARQVAGQLREEFREAADWLPPDAAGLLPGMVTGDTSALPESLDVAMKATGMSHLTAVSGANCSLILGGLILLARCLRLPRPAAAAFALCGLFAFVVMVGPDASVLRAAVMGAVGLAALSGGLAGRSLSFLCLAAVALLVLDPSMANDVGFLLSVLATLGIVLLGARIASWVPAQIPRWLAAGVAVPLAAQVLCGPVIVALQPQFSSYSLIANVVVGPFVAPVTVLGTVAVPVTALAPWLGAVPLAVAGLCAGVVAAVARFFAGLPGASLPWAEGTWGTASMAVLSVVTIVVAWMVFHLEGVFSHTISLHGRISGLLERLEASSTLPPTRRHGRLGVCKKPSGRNHQWLLPKPPGPRVLRRTTSVGAMLRRPP